MAWSLFLCHQPPCWITDIITNISCMTSLTSALFKRLSSTANLLSWCNDSHTHTHTYKWLVWIWSASGTAAYGDGYEAKIISVLRSLSNDVIFFLKFLKSGDWNFWKTKSKLNKAFCLSLLRRDELSCYVLRHVFLWLSCCHEKNLASDCNSRGSNSNKIFGFGVKAGTYGPH